MSGMYRHKSISINIAKIITCLAMASTISLMPAFAQQIIN